MITTISVVIPVFNSEKSLPILAQRIENVLAKLDKNWEVIFVCDASPDCSWNVIEKICQDNHNFRGILLGRNMGQAKATICGIKSTLGEIIVTIDDDLQHNPEDIPLLLDELDSDQGYDGIFAFFKEKKHQAYRKIGTKLIWYINNQAFGLRNIQISSFRVMRRNIVNFIKDNDSSIATPGSLMLAATQNIKSVPLKHNERLYGKSNYTFYKQIHAAINNLVSVSLLPLRLISGLGIATAGFAAIMVIYTLTRYFTTGFGVPGWTTLVILLTFFSGMILLSLGVIGEYIVRLLRELQYPKDTPVRKKINFYPKCSD